MKCIVVLGAGFAGLIAAVGAARKLAELSIGRADIAVTVVNRDPWHAIRVRNYETDLSDVRVPLDDVLGPIGVDLVIGEVTAIDCEQRAVILKQDAASGRWVTSGWFSRWAASWCGHPFRDWPNMASTSTPTMRRRGWGRISIACGAGLLRPAGTPRWWSAAG